MKTRKMTENAHKIAFLISAYPEHTLNEIIKLVELPAIDINTAIWTAQELGFISQPNKETARLDVLKLPKVWNFGPEEGALEDAILYSFQQLAKKETDLEENYLTEWTRGYSAHDVLIAMKQLINDKQLAEYTLNDTGKDGVVTPYTFYTLYENGEQMWGKKQFKKEPKEV